MQYCLYLRKSRADLEAEAHGEGETLARHEKILLDLANRMNLNITQIYREIVSGETIAARPVMQRLLQEVEDGLWTGVLVVEVERLARGDTIDQGIVSQAFKFSDTKIITPAKVYDPSNEFDEEYFEFGLFMSRREYKTINRRLQQGRVASVKEGKWASGKTPYGYKRVRISQGKGWTLEPSEPEADTVRYIFSLYADGEPDTTPKRKQHCGESIASKLNEMKIPPPQGAAYWRRTVVMYILSNPVYIGKVRWYHTKYKKKISDNKIITSRSFSPPEEQMIVQGIHPPIVDEELFYRVQDRISRHGPPPVPASKNLANPLAGIIFCGLCGYHMSFARDSHGGAILCPNPYCNNISAKYPLIEKRLLESLQSWLDAYRLSWDSSDNDAQSAIDMREKALSRAKSELDKLRRQMSRTHDLLEQGIYDTDTFLARSRELTDRINAANDNIASLTDELGKEKQRAASRADIIPKIEHLLAVYPSLPDADTKNKMLKEVIDKVVYTRLTNTHKKADMDNFDLTVYPKLPHNDL